MNNILRKQIKELKINQNITYREIAEYLEITRNSFYNWINGYYNLGDEKQQRLKEIINNLKED